MIDFIPMRVDSGQTAPYGRYPGVLPLLNSVI